MKIEGGSFYAETVKAMVEAGIPVMAHIGFTPQSEHALGSYRFQLRGDDGWRLIDDAVALADAPLTATVGRTQGRTERL